jgi:hypothetical protein
MKPTSFTRVVARLSILGVLVLPPIVHGGCLQKAAYQARLQEKVRAHVYAEKAQVVLKAARKLAEHDGWTIEDGDEDEDRAFTTKTRTLDGMKQKLSVKVIKEADGVRLEGTLEKQLKSASDEDTTRFPATDFELAVFEKLDPDGAASVKKKATKQSKEDAKQIRACARKAIDEDEKSEEE